METGIYKIAGVCIRISSLHGDVQELCCDYAHTDEPELEIRITQEDIHREQELSAQEDALEGRPVHAYPEGYLETLAVYRKLADALLKKDIVLFHGSVIAVDGKAYLFTAKSGTGKSTHTRLWRELFGDRAVMVNDDKPLLAVTPEGVVAYGTPWNGKHRLGCNMSAPLEAVCILERGEENRIESVSPVEALPMLLQQSHRPAGAASRLAYLELLDKLAGAVRFYRLHCNMDIQAARVAYEGMQK